MDDIEFLYLIGSFKEYVNKVELYHGRLAMVSFVTTLCVYKVTGQIVPGIF